MASATWAQMPVRVPLPIPARLPADDTSWHGNPPQTMSGWPCSSTTACQSVLVRSPRFGVVGQWWARIRFAPGSTSDTQAVVPPNTDSTAMSRPR